MEKIIVSAVLAVVFGMAFAAFLLSLERRTERTDTDDGEGAADAAAGRYMRRHSTIEYRRGYMRACGEEHKHHWRTK